MSATDKLRNLLDKYGITWKQGVNSFVTVTPEWIFAENSGKLSVDSKGSFFSPTEAMIIAYGSDIAEKEGYYNWTFHEDTYQITDDVYCFEYKCGHRDFGFDKKVPKFCSICGKRIFTI